MEHHKVKFLFYHSLIAVIIIIQYSLFLHTELYPFDMSLEENFVEKYVSIGLLSSTMQGKKTSWLSNLSFLVTSQQVMPIWAVSPKGLKQMKKYSHSLLAVRVDQKYIFFQNYHLPWVNLIDITQCDVVIYWLVLYKSKLLFWTLCLTYYKVISNIFSFDCGIILIIWSYEFKIYICISLTLQFVANPISKTKQDVHYITVQNEFNSNWFMKQTLYLQKSVVRHKNGTIPLSSKVIFTSHLHF